MSKNKRHHGAAPVAFTAPFGENQPGSNDPRTRIIHIFSENLDVSSILKDIDIKKNGFSINHPTLGSDFIETAWANNFESGYPAVRNKVLNGAWPITGDDREKMSRMFSAAMVKNHHLQEHLVESAIQYFTSLMSKSFSEKDVLDSLKIHKDQIIALTKGAAHDRALHLSKMFLKYPWALVKTETPLFTGNAPLALGYFNTPPGKSSFSLTGIRQFDYFAIAINPRKAIMGFMRDPNRKYLGDYLSNKDGSKDVIVEDSKGDKARSIRGAIGSVSQFIYVHPKDVNFFRNEDGSIDLLR